MFIDKICENNRFNSFQKNRLFLSLNDDDKKLYRFVDDYFKDYCDFFNISVDDVNRIKDRFSNHYSSDIKNFIDTGKYPLELTPDTPNTLERVEYDVILILSYLLEKHRFKILKWLALKDFSNKMVLAVGVGPGVEIGMILDFLGYSCSVEAYDLEFSAYVNNRYGDMVKKEFFVGTEKKFDTVILIEVLEHLSNPLDLLKAISKSMIRGGYLYATTAIDIPQFDHLYNFKEKEVVDLFAECELEMIDIQNIKHGTVLSKIDSINEVVEAIKC